MIPTALWVVGTPFLLLLCAAGLLLLGFRPPKSTSFMGKRKGRLQVLLAVLPLALLLFLISVPGLDRVGYVGFEVAFALLCWLCIDALRDPKSLFLLWLPRFGPLPSERTLSRLLLGIRVGVALCLLAAAAFFLLLLPHVFVG